MTPDERKMVKMQSVYIPVTLFIGIIGSVIWTSWLVFSDRATVYSRINNVDRSVQQLTEAVKTISERIDKPQTSYLSRQDYVIGCLNHQILNPEWFCQYGPMKPWVARVKKAR